MGITQAVHNAEKFLVINHVEGRAKVKVGSIKVLVEEGSILNVVE
jgi:mannose-6-phosphate isomerase-like protein (cupin superfamily)